MAEVERCTYCALRHILPGQNLLQWQGYIPHCPHELRRYLAVTKMKSAYLWHCYNPYAISELKQMLVKDTPLDPAGL